MSHMCGRTSSDKVKIFNRQSKTTNKNILVKRFTADCKYLNHHSKTEGQMKRLRSRKERSRTRGGGKEASNSKSHRHHHHHCQSTKDMAHFQSCCHNSCHCLSKRNAHFPSAIPAAQEPSIITDSRLIGHHGLFNHEVKSVDIERLLSKQRKLEKKRQHGQEKKNITSHPSLASHIPSPFSTYDLLAADKVLTFEKNAAHDDKEISQGSDITPGQRPLQQCDLSSGSFKTTSPSKNNSLNVVMSKSMKTSPVTSEKGRKSPLTLPVVRENVEKSNRKVKGHMISTLEHTPKNQESPVHQTQTPGLIPNTVQLSSSHAAASSDIQHKGPDPSFVSKSVSAVAAGLCKRLQFPLLRRRNLVAESRKVLWKALRERHGSRLQENLLEVKHCLNFGDPTKEVQHQKPAMVDPASQLCFEETTSFGMMGSQHFNWKSCPQPHQNLEQTAEWITSPVETSVSLVDEVLRPACAPQFFMDFEPSGASASDHLFCPTSSWGKKTPAFQHWEDHLSFPKSSKAVMFDCFENSHMNHTRAFPERRSRAQSSGSNIQPFFPYQTQQSDRRSPEPMRYPKQKDPFAATQIHHQQECLQPFSQFSIPSTCPPLRPHHTDMRHYPPSHMLDRDPAAPLSSLSSPEHWSFPPMRLY